MIVEFRTYTLHPRTLPEFLKRFSDKLERRQTYSKLAAFWYTEFGPLNQVIHMWGYDGFEERARRRAELVKSDGWLTYLPMNRDKILSQENKLLVPTPFFDPAKGPATT